MDSHTVGRDQIRDGPRSPAHDRERRLELLVRQLPRPLQAAVRWLRQPSARWFRISASVLLILGSLLSVFSIFGLWMLPLGLVLLAEDIAPLRRATDRILVPLHRGFDGLSVHGTVRICGIDPAWPCSQHVGAANLARGPAVPDLDVSRLPKCHSLFDIMCNGATWAIRQNHCAEVL